MQLFILHGPGLVTLRSRLMAIKKQYEGALISEYAGPDLEFSQLLVEMGSLGLFSPTRLIIISSPDTDLDLEKLPNTENLGLVITFPKTIPSNSKFLKAATARSAQIMQFSEAEEISVFPFLDALAEKKSAAFEQLQKLLKEYGSQYILTMIFYSLRKFVLPSHNLPPFILKKHQFQARNFPLPRIKLLYFQTIETDYKIKLGLIDEMNGLTMLTENFLKS